MASYALGVACVLAVVLSITIVGICARRILLPNWGGPVATLTTVVMALTALRLGAQVLGSAHDLRRWPIVGLFALLAVLSWWLAPRPLWRQGTSRLLRPRRIRAGAVLAALAVGCVAAQWLVDLRRTVQTGILSLDSLHYHLSTAAYFAQSHTTWRIHHLSAGDATAYYPFNDELLHGLGMLLMGNDSLSLLLSAADMAAAFYAAYAFGTVYKAGSVALCAIAPVAVVLGPDYAGGALNDWAATWPWIAAIAALAYALKRDRFLNRGALVAAGLGAGAALGTKLDYVVPVVLLTLAVLWLARGPDWFARWLTFIAGAVLGGGYWYLRDIVAVGSPLPETKLPFISGPSLPDLARVNFSVAHYLTDETIVRQFFFPGIKSFFGPLWFVILAAVGAGVLWGLIQRSRPFLRLLAALSLLGIAAYIVTPTSAAGTAGHPSLFVYNIRYSWPGLVLALLVLAVLPRRERSQVAVAAGGLLVAVLTLSRRSSWVAQWPTKAFLLAALFAVLAVAALLAARYWPRSYWWALGPALALLCVGGYPVEHHYLANRYDTTGSPLQSLMRAGQAISRARVAVVGYPLQYPFYGATLSNTVDYLAASGAHHSFEDYGSCQQYRAALARGGYDYVVVEPIPHGPAVPALAWTQDDPGATVVFANQAGTIFRLRQASVRNC